MATSRFSTPAVRFAAAASVVAAAILALVVFSLRGSTAYYVTPGELAAAPVRTVDHVRVAGKVVPGSIHKQGSTTTFDVSDRSATVAVTTDDVLPDAFAPGAEVVAEGAMTNRKVFSAAKVLAKCPSKFTVKPPAAAQPAQPAQPVRPG
jgi:cytochrome c-type biogenesis protein CcmE